VGYWSIVAVPISVYLFGALAFVMLLNWMTALVFFGLCVLIAYFGFRRWQKYHQSGKYDDHHYSETPIRR
jgi:membrane protein implicated in regulation of membrane protease activity